MSRRVRPNAQSATPPTTMIAATTIPTGSKMPGHRLAEVLVERQVEDRIGQLERRAQRVDEERRDDQERRHAGRQRRPDETADGEPDRRRTRPRASPRTPMPATGVDDVAALRRDGDPDDAPR